MVFPAERKALGARLGLDLSRPFMELAKTHRAALERFMRELIEREPEIEGARQGLGQVLLLHGEYDAGWAEWAWRGSEVRRMWNGERVDGTIAIRADMGVGDCIQFARYIPLVAERCRTVVVHCRGYEGVMPLLGQLATTALYPIRQRRVLLSTLGAVFRTIPPPATFRTNPQPWLERIKGGRRIGLVWNSRKVLPKGKHRNVPFEVFRPIVDAAPAEATLIACTPEREEADPRIVWPDLADFQDTADLIAGLDLVITVDTAVAHLAGTLGVPTWIVLPFANDWRWGIEGEIRPWYPAVRLFRQPGLPDNWAGAVDGVCKALAAR